MKDQPADEELLRKELNRLTTIIRTLRTEGTKLDEGLLKNIQIMAKSADEWGKQLTIEKGKTDRLKGVADRMEKNHDWIDKHTATMAKNRAQQQANSLGKQREHQQDVQTNIKYRSIQAKAGEQMNFFTKALHGGVGLGTIFERLGGKIYQTAKQFEILAEVVRQTAEIDDLKAKGASPANDDAIAKLESEKESNVRALGGKEKVEGMMKDTTQNKMGKSLGAMGKFAKKHAMGMALGIGAGGLILSTIIKALSVAPMFQAMMKLFKFAVMMILMPIGTFFGAVLRPIMIGLVKTIAPQFKDWMKTSMAMGDEVAKLIMAFADNPLEYLSKIFTGAFGILWSGLEKLIPDFLKPKDQTQKDQEQKEHDEYWAGVTKSLDAAWLSIYTPLVDFGALVFDFFTKTLPDAFTGGLKKATDGLKFIGKLLLMPLLTFIGTINSIFLWMMPELFNNFWTWVSTGFTNLQDSLSAWLDPILRFFGFSKPEEDMKTVDESVTTMATLAEDIREWWEKISGNTESSEEHSETTDDAMLAIGKIFHGSAQWINNALSKISGQTYTNSNGDEVPTAEAITAQNTPYVTIGSPIPAANGFSGMVNKPTLFLAGEAGSESVNISPHGSSSSSHVGGAVININIGKVERDADMDRLKPLIQRWILEANSRRGMI